MLVSDYMESLIQSEIKPLTICDVGDLAAEAYVPITPTQEKNRKTLILYIDQANKRLHDRFSLIQKELLFTDVYHDDILALPTDYTYPISGALQDGTRVSVNNDRPGACIALMFPAPFQIIAKFSNLDIDLLRASCKPPANISLTYCCAPPTLTAVTDFIDLSGAFTQALLYYAAFKAYSSVSGDLKAESNTYYLRYEAACKEIEAFGLLAQENQDNIRLEERGFV